MRFEIAQLGPKKLKAVATLARAWSFECFPPSGDGIYELVNSRLLTTQFDVAQVNWIPCSRNGLDPNRLLAFGFDLQNT